MPIKYRTGFSEFQYLKGCMKLYTTITIKNHMKLVRFCVQQKPRSMFGISIGGSGYFFGRIFSFTFSNVYLKFTICFPTSWGDINYKVPYTTVKQVLASYRINSKISAILGLGFGLRSEPKQFRINKKSCCSCSNWTGRTVLKIYALLLNYPTFVDVFFFHFQWQIQSLCTLQRKH